MRESERADIGKQRQGQPFQHRDVALVVEEDLRCHRDHAIEHDIDDGRPANQQLRRIRHRSKIGGNVDGVGDEQRRHRDDEDPAG